MTTRTPEREKRIQDAMDARPKLKITLAEARNPETREMVRLHRWNIGDVVSLSPRQHEHALAQRWGVEVKEAKAGKDKEK